MENDILDSLEDLGYSGPALDDGVFDSFVENGPCQQQFTELVSWLTDQIKSFTGLEEHVNPITSSEDSAEFVMELSGFLRELICPYNHLYEGGPVTERVNSKENKLQLLDYLTSELATIRVLAVKKPGLLKAADQNKPEDVKESDVAKHLKFMLMGLSFPKPPVNVTSFQLFSKVENKIKEILTKHPMQVGKPLLKARLSDMQWEQILKINNSLALEYQTRREMLLKRLDVTIQSFMWGDNAKKKQNDIAAVYQPIRKLLMGKTAISVAQILAARDDLTRLEKTSSGEARDKTRCAINKVRIPKVPDRGGRAWELEPPPPEMPSFVKRVDQPQQQRPQSGYNSGRGDRGRGDRERGGDRGGGGRGGKVQGGWGDNQSQQFGGQWNQGGGGGQGGRGGGGYQGGGSGGYQGGGGGGYQGSGGGGYQGSGGGGYQGGGGGGGHRGGGGGYDQEGRSGSARGGRGGRGGGRGGRGGNR
ncbi:protein FAM98A-like isoform X1 [Mytilus edulis]|uniref:protein FAM98A-like isoform X1 n=1 Tax=Mytilus edulis TaxID=6550 RepID=UPI0039F10F80